MYKRLPALPVLSCSATVLSVVPPATSHSHLCALMCARKLSAPRWSLQLVELHGCKRWAFIASQMGQKGAKQCRRRWQNYLNNADAKSGGWSAEEARAVFLSPNTPPHPHTRTACPGAPAPSRVPAFARARLRASQSARELTGRADALRSPFGPLPVAVAGRAAAGRPRQVGQPVDGDCQDGDRPHGQRCAWALCSAPGLSLTDEAALRLFPSQLLRTATRCWSRRWRVLTPCVFGFVLTPTFSLSSWSLFFWLT